MSKWTRKLEKLGKCRAKPRRSGRYLGKTKGKGEKPSRGQRECGKMEKRAGVCYG